MVSSPSPQPGTPPFRVRPARRGDAAGIIAILGESGGGGDAATVSWIISHPEMELLVAADPFDKPVGFVTFSHRPRLQLGGRSGTVDELAVTPSWRRRGVGSALLRRVVERAKVLAVKRLEANVDAVSPALESFFAKCDFAAAESAAYRLRSP